MYVKEFSAQSDWMHHGEGLQLFNRMALSAPDLPAYRERARRFAGFYMGEDPDAPNYDPEQEADSLDDQRQPRPAAAQGDGARLGRRSVRRDRASSRSTARAPTRSSSSTTRNTPTSSATTSSTWSPRRCRPTPICVTGEAKYRRWIVDYMDAWLARMQAERRHHPELRRSRRHASAGPDGSGGATPTAGASARSTR